MDVKPVKKIQIQQRLQHFEKNFTFDDENKKIVQLNSKIKPPRDIEGSVTFAYGSDGLKLAASLSESIREDFPNIQANLLSYSQTETRKIIDSADIVVIFVSDEFLASQHHVEELHIALCRQRNVKDSTVVYIVEVEHQAPTPFYFNLLPCNVCIDDPVWQKYAKKFQISVHRYVVKTPGMEGTYMCSSAEHVALMKMKIDLVELLCQRGQGSTLPTNLINIVKVQQSNKGKDDGNILLSQIPTLTSFKPYMRFKAAETGEAFNYADEVQEEDDHADEDNSFSSRPIDPADRVIAEMNEFFITKLTPEMALQLHEENSCLLNKALKDAYMTELIKSEFDNETEASHSGNFKYISKNRSSVQGDKEKGDSDGKNDHEVGNNDGKSDKGMGENNENSDKEKADTDKSSVTDVINSNQSNEDSQRKHALKSGKSKSCIII